MNEISFVSWGISVGLFTCEAIPEADRADAAKQQLVRATLAACDAIWLADPRARLLHCDPLIHIVPDSADPASDVLAREMCDTQYQAWDMLSGRLNPELGGAPRYLDLIGVNYYHDNQWEQGSNQRLYWHLGDSRRLPLHRMLQQVWQRYQRPLLLAETSHVGSGRGSWILEIAAQVAQAQLAGVELHGICLYPILDRPLWEETTFWTRSGLWDLDLLGPIPMPASYSSLMPTHYVRRSAFAAHPLLKTPLSGAHYETTCSHRFQPFTLGICFSASAAATDTTGTALSRAVCRRAGLAGGATGPASELACR